MDVPITCFLGDIGPLLAQLRSLVDTEQSLPQGINKDELRGLIQDLNEIKTSSMDLAEDEDPPFTDKCWMKEVREISYDAKDYLDTVMQAGDHDHKIHWIRTAKMKRQWRPKIAQDISELRARLQGAKERSGGRQLADLRSRLRQEMTDRRKRCQLALADFQTFAKWMLQASHAGLHEPINELQRLLAFERDKQLKVVPILGSLGVGKTTLARKLYHHYGERFQCRAFLRVSRNPDPRRLLTSMLSQIKGPRPNGLSDVQDLADNINKHLQGKRYFIIIDDLWATSVWDIISHAFPEGNCYSRIVTTTQIENVALACCGFSAEHIYKMRPLSDVHSRLPGNLEVTKEVVNLIYNDLPPHLKTCLLYLSIYADDYSIWKDDLVRLWVAEGFVCKVDGKDIEEVAMGYFDELLTRGMIQPVDTSYNDEVLSCTVHDIVLDLITNISMEENFIAVVDYSETVTGLPDKVRRLSMKFGGAKSAQIPEGFRMYQVRSLIFFGFFKSVPSVVQYKLVRVLFLHVWTDNDKDSLDLDKIHELFQLRYLKVECNMTVKLPSKMTELKYLETLEIDARATVIPSDIIRLQHLLHLRLPSEVDWPNKIGCMTSLRSLGYFNISTSSKDNVLGLGELYKLQDLHLTSYIVPSKNHLLSNMDYLAYALGTLGKCNSLKSLIMNGETSSGTSISYDSWASLSPPLLLQRLELAPRICIFSSQPKWIGHLSRLCILKIAVGNLSRNDINVLKGLNALRTLSLYVSTATAERIFFDEGFIVLKHFKFICSEFCLVFLKGAMPNVQCLKLGFNASTIEQYIPIDAGFENLTRLEVLSAKIVGAGADESSRKAVQTALENVYSKRGSCPVINVRSGQYKSYVKPVLITKARSDKQYGIEENDLTVDKNSRADGRVSVSLESPSHMRNPGENKSSESHIERSEIEESKDVNTEKQYGIQEKDYDDGTYMQPTSRTSVPTESSSHRKDTAFYRLGPEDQNREEKERKGDNQIVTKMSDVAFGGVEKLVKVALAIQEAVKTVKQNNKECRAIEKCVTRCTDLLQPLEEQTDTMKDEAMRGPLEDVTESLEEALELVKLCQQKHYFSRLWKAGDMAKELRRVQDDILRKVSFATTIHATVMLAALHETSPPRSRPP